MANANFLMSREALEEIISELTCYSCKMVPDSYGQRKNVYVCDNSGHSLCENCKNKCLCGSTVTRTHSKAISALLKSLPQYCKHFLQGCRERLTKEEMKNHEKGCIYRQIVCPDFGCQLKVPFHSLSQHVDDDKHEMVDLKMVEDSKSFLFRLKNTQHVMNLGKLGLRKIVCQSATFFVSGSFSNEVMHLWMFYYGSADEAKNYEFSATMASKTCKMNTLHGPIYPIDADYNEIWSNFYIVTVHKRFMLGIIEKYGDFTIDFKIHCLKEEA